MISPGIDREDLEAAWGTAGLDPAPLVELLAPGTDIRVIGERFLAEVLEPEINTVLDEARGLRDRHRLGDLEARRLDLVRVFTCLRRAGAIADIPAREPQVTVETIARSTT